MKVGWIRDMITEMMFENLDALTPDSAETTVKGFIGISAIRLKSMTKGRYELHEAVSEIGEFLSICDMNHGDPDYDWTAGAARELAEIAYHERNN